MSTRYEIEGMHCQGCASSIQDALRGVDGVRSATVSLEAREAEIDADDSVGREALAGAVERAGDYKLGDELDSPAESRGAGADDSHGAPVEEEEESLYPLLLIVGFIAGVTVLIAAETGAWSVEPMMRHFMAGFFIVFSFFKLLDLPGFVNAYFSYDLIARAIPKWGWVYPFVELGLGVLYLLNAVPIATNIITLVLMLIGSVGVLKALMEKRKIRCACLGTALNLPMTKVTLVEDLTMAAMAAAMLVMYAAG